MEDHDLIDAVRRIGAEQLDKAIASADGGDDLATRVHDIRKRMKKLRGLIRLVREDFPDYKRENGHFRDIARSISGLRDAQVMGQTLTDLLDGHEDPLQLEAFAEFRACVDEAAASDPSDIDLDPVREALERARHRVDTWTLHETGWDAAAGGLAQTYRRARKGLKARGDAELHDWRKRLKYHWYHVRLLNGIWPQAMDVRETAAAEVGEYMGLYQDLTVLGHQVEIGPLDSETARVLRGLIEQRKSERLAAVRAIAARLLAEKPSAMVARWGTLWDIWRG